MRIIDKLYNRYIYFLRNNRINIFNFEGFKISSKNPQTFLQLKYEIFNQEIYKFNKKNEKPIIVDCGANIGMSVIYFKKEYPNSQVYAFEPDESNYNLLKKNVESNDLDDVFIFKKAVWIDNTMLTFSNFGDVSGRIEFGSSHSKTINVEAIDFFDFLKKFHSIDLLKIDIEGAENIVVPHIESCLKIVENIFIEYHSTYNQAQELDNLLNILKRNDFRYCIHDVYADKYKLNKKPLVDRNNNMGFDMQLNIFGFKEKN